MIQVNIHVAKTRLSGLFEYVQNGEEVVITKAGKPIARLSKFIAPKSLFFGLVPQLRTPDEFDTPLPSQILELFEGKA